MCDTADVALTDSLLRSEFRFILTRSRSGMLTAHFVCGLTSELMICKFSRSIVIHDTECPYCDQLSLNNPNPKTNPRSGSVFICGHNI